MVIVALDCLDGGRWRKWGRTKGVEGVRAPRIGVVDGIREEGCGSNKV